MQRSLDLSINIKGVFPPQAKNVQQSCTMKLPLRPHPYDIIQKKRKLFRRHYQAPANDHIIIYYTGPFNKNGFFSPQDINHIKLGRNFRPSPKQADSLFSQFPNLAKLSIGLQSFFRKDFKQICQSISKHCPYIQEVGVSAIDQQMIHTFLRYFHRLKKVSFCIFILNETHVDRYNLFQLEEVHITLADIKKFQFSPIFTMKNLKSLTLDTKLSEDKQIEEYEQLTFLKCCINWTILIVHKKQYNFIHMLMHILSQIQNLGRLQVSFFCANSHAVFENFCTFLHSNVKKLSLKIPQQYSHVYPIQVLSSNNRQIDEVQFTLNNKCDFVQTVEALDSWKLKSLILNSASVDEFGMQLLIVCQPQLLVLSLESCENITDETIITISLLSELKGLSLTNYANISNNSLIYLRRLKKLQILFLINVKVLFSWGCFTKFIGNLKMAPQMEYYDKWFEDERKAKRMEENWNKGINVWMKKQRK